mgnify:CR=1 FL=1
MFAASLGEWQYSALALAAGFTAAVFATGFAATVLAALAGAAFALAATTGFEVFLGADLLLASG